MDLKELIRTEPTLRSTFEEIDAEYVEVERHASALLKRRSELAEKLAEIEEAKRQLQQPKTLQADEDDTDVLIEEQGEPDPLPAAKPYQGTDE